MVDVARAPHLPFALADSSRAALKESRDYIDSTRMHDEAPMMCRNNTGVGLLKDIHIEVEHIGLFQTQLIKVHCAGIDELFSEAVSRATHAIAC